MGALSPVHLIIILVIALLVIGPGKLPETGAALGRAIRDFRQAMDGTQPAGLPPATDPVSPEPIQVSAVSAVSATPDEAGTTGPS